VRRISVVGNSGSGKSTLAAQLAAALGIPHLARADTVVWLDPSRARVMRQLMPRTLLRMMRRTELWNGNRESWTALFRADPQKSILRWAWTQHAPTRERYARAQADPAHAHLTFVRLATPAQVAEFTRQARARAR
jgi:adenylate kinase family enzyme